MPRIIYIKEGKTKGYLKIGITDGDGRTSLTVSEQAYYSVGAPVCKAELDADTLSVLMGSDAEYKALMKALSYLSYADNSERTLVIKLIRAGFSREVASKTAMEAVRLGYINEERQLERLILSEANNRLTGPMKLMQKLVAKGYGASTVKAVLEGLVSSGEIDFNENRERLIAQKLTEDSTDEERKKLLYKYGYKIC